MALLAGKAMDLVFDRGTIARAYPFDHARIHGGAVEPAPDDFVRARIGVGDPAR